MLKHLNSLIYISAILFFTACGSSSSDGNKDEVSSENQPLVSIASSSADYTNLNLKQEMVESWEDAMRTNGKSGSFEWWYADYTFSDGTTVVVAFYTKMVFDTYGASLPMVTINIVQPDGTEINNQSFQLPNSKINASKEIANVHIGSSFIENIDGHYELRYKNGGIEFNATMISTLPMWRKDTGFLYFGEEKQNYFAWLVAQPSSTVTASLTVDGVRKSLIGDGYHDHNWGNSAMHENMESWYWGRAKVGDYTLIFSEITAHKDFNSTKVPLLFIAKGNEVLEIGGDITVEKREIKRDNQTGKDYAHKLIFSYTSKENQTFTIEVNKKRNLAFIDMNQLPFESGDDPTYLRTFNDITLFVQDANGSVETLSGVGIVEQVRFF